MTSALEEKFSSAHVIDPAKGFDLTKLRGKTAVITGGASGIGEATLRAFVKAGAFVVFGDISQDRGDAIADELGPENVAFVQGDVTNWSDQKRLFRTGVEKSPSGCLNVVFANAAIVKVVDPVVEDAVDEHGDPVEPNLDVVDIGIRGTLLTTKLAVHYFRRQLPKGDNDHCLVITASIAGYWDHPWHPQYAMMKWGARGLMRSLRSSLPESEMRVNIIAPWYIRTNLISQQGWDNLEENRGVLLAEKDDAAKAVLHLVCDESIHGRSLMIVPRKEASEGYVDTNRDSHDVEVIGRERFSWKK